LFQIFHRFILIIFYPFILYFFSFLQSLLPTFWDYASKKNMNFLRRQESLKRLSTLSPFSKGSPQSGGGGILTFHCSVFTYSPVSSRILRYMLWLEVRGVIDCLITIRILWWESLSGLFVYSHHIYHWSK